jgi:hypothetical protein
MSFEEKKIFGNVKMELSIFFRKTCNLLSPKQVTGFEPLLLGL